MLTARWFIQGNEPRHVQLHTGKGFEGTLNALDSAVHHAHRLNARNAYTQSQTSAIKVSEMLCESHACMGMTC